MGKYQIIVGRFEHVDLINRLVGIPAKIDTGAFRSSIHATNIQVIEKNGHPTLRFVILGHPAYGKHRTIETRVFNTRHVRSSNGYSADRYEVKFKIRLGYKIFRTPFTLADRKDNVFPVLIGRKTLNKRYLVDPDKAGISRVELKTAAASVEVESEDMEGVNT